VFKGLENVGGVLVSVKVLRISVESSSFEDVGEVNLKLVVTECKFKCWIVF
jgi:hypothetical protein